MGPLPGEGPEVIVPVRGGGEWAAGVERLCHRLCLGVLLEVGGKPGVLEVPLVIHEGLEDAGGGVEGLGDVGLLHGPRASSTGCCLSSPASGVRGSANWGWMSWTWQGPLCCMHGSTDGLSRGEVGVNGVEFHLWPPGEELAGTPPGLGPVRESRLPEAVCSTPPVCDLVRGSVAGWNTLSGSVASSWYPSSCR